MSTISSLKKSSLLLSHLLMSLLLLLSLLAVLDKVMSVCQFVLLLPQKSHLTVMQLLVMKCFELQFGTPD